jgi:DNA-binding NarL/FixJ family response regulator
LASKKSRKLRILLADDSESFVRGAQLLLRDYDVDAASDGEEALAKIGARVPDVVFVDLVLPKISGTDLIGQLRTRYPKLVIVALTAIDDEDTVREVLRLGASDYMIKGALSADSFRASIKRALEKLH